ncbi:MAG: glycosyltransferase family 4 protein [Chthoniobacterales bacterium]
MRLNLWSSGLYSSQGGIQVYSRFLLDAIRHVVPAHRLGVISLSDSSADLAILQEQGIQCTGLGQGPNALRKARFMLSDFKMARGRNELTVNWLTHLNFCPLAAAAQSLFRAPFLVSAHGIEAWNVQSPLVRWSLGKADAIAAVSEFTQNRMQETLRLPADRFEILYNTVDPASFKIQPKPTWLVERHGLRPNSPVVLTVGRLEASEQYKGYDQVLLALPTILQRSPETKYIIVGEGNDQSRLRMLVEQLGLKSSVIFAGFAPTDELGAYYALCDVFVMPSKKEGFGIVFLEAMCCGKPVVAGNGDGSVNALKNGELGILVDPDDTQAIADAVISALCRTTGNPLLSDPEMLRAKMLGHFGLKIFRDRVKNILGTFGFGVDLESEQMKISPAFNVS